MSRGTKERGGTDMTHDGRTHVYNKRTNPSGCDKFYCLRKYRPIYYWVRWQPRGGWRTW